MTNPTRSEVVAAVDRLLAGVDTRTAASIRASMWHLGDIADPLVEEAVDLLTLIDAHQFDASGVRVGYMYSLDDLRAVRARMVEG